MIMLPALPAWSAAVLVPPVPVFRSKSPDLPAAAVPDPPPLPVLIVRLPELPALPLPTFVPPLPVSIVSAPLLALLVLVRSPVLMAKDSVAEVAWSLDFRVLLDSSK
jgi:hypothetical protein